MKKTEQRAALTKAVINLIEVPEIQDYLKEQLKETLYEIFKEVSSYDLSVEVTNLFSEIINRETEKYIMAEVNENLDALIKGAVKSRAAAIVKKGLKE